MELLAFAFVIASGHTGMRRDWAACNQEEQQ